ncbi:MAG: precorrin-6y C5,15-methyltransferase (decarboxylating) subunit CbiE [Chloroflexi bacterium]|nr:precorrin-6y C5,15-methyltransferase (decarboxylating) subunit CbiE [Chloroflexota bacterium]
MSKILVLGLSAAGRTDLPLALQQRVLAAHLLIGGARHLGYFAEFAGETFAVTNNMDAMLARIEQSMRHSERVVVLASGDPLWYGLGATLRRHFSADQMEIIPAPTAAQLAFAALGEPWSDALLLSAHGRPLDAVIAQTCGASKAAILTDPLNNPAAIASALMQAGLAAETPCAVCENLGSPAQRIQRGHLSWMAAGQFAALNVVIVWNRTPRQAIAPGLPDEAFATNAGQITKREVRLLSLAELALGPGEVLWDIGAGSGSVGIEAARSQPTARVYAIEQRAPMLAHLQENLRRWPAPNLQAQRGTAPENCVSWPDPQAIFIGGSGGQLAALIELAQQRLHPQGRLVINLATLEHLHEAQRLLPTAQIVQVQISRVVPILTLTRLEAYNPVFVITWRKVGDAVQSVCL